jgi:hypothetical protein
MWRETDSKVIEIASKGNGIRWHFADWKDSFILLYKHHGWPVNVLRRLRESTQVDAIILKLPSNVQQWLANAA